MTMAFRFGATPAYAGIVHDRVDSLREERLGGLLTIGEFRARRYEPAMRTVTSAHDRLQETLEQARRAGELLRTRVDTLSGHSRRLCPTCRRGSQTLRAVCVPR